MGVSRFGYSDEDLWASEPIPEVPQDASHLVDGLTIEQARAVTHRDGPLLIVAGAGSGKTRVLTRRIAHLLATGDARPAEILAITFTNKAADEMRHRVVDLIGDDAKSMWVATFHSACLRLLRMYPTAVGYEANFTIYDADDAQGLIDRLMKERGMDGKTPSTRAVTAMISAAKNRMESPSEWAENNSFTPRSAEIAAVYGAYVSELRKSNAMDFDDLLLNAVRLLRDNPAILANLQDRFRHILVDEFQDTNYVQNHFVTLLADRYRQICVVGDSDQSIYRFRAADVRNILEFAERFPDADTVMLEENFRSTQNILDAANAVIRLNTSRHPKNLYTRRGQGSPIVMYKGGDEYDEATFITREVSRLRREENIGYGEMAIFYRTNAQSRVLEEIFRGAAIPYRVVSGQRFYERKEIKDALAYARLVVNPRDDQAVRRVINEPKRGVGAMAMAKLAIFAQERNQSLLDAATQVEESGLTPQAVRGVKAFVEIVETLRAMNNDLSPADMIGAIVEQSGLGEALRAENTEEARGRLENLGELASAAAQHQSLEEYLERMALSAESDHLDDGSGSVSMMTMHVAKGLEFEAVFVTGLEEGVFPHSRAHADPDELEEERRLCYVALTRAKAHLALSMAWTRTMWGRVVDGLPSRFLAEIPEELTDNRSSRAPLRRSTFSDDGFIGRTTEFTEGRAFGAGTPPRPTSTGAENLGLRPGDRVVHDRFGGGTVMTTEGAGAQMRADVNFDAHGRKKLILAMTPLRRE